MKLENLSDTNTKLSREKFIKGAAGVLAAAVASPLLAEYEDHSHHEQHNMHNKLIGATSECIVNGEICLSHCIELVKTKDTSIAGCLASVNDMIPVCQGLLTLAISNSKHLKAYAKVCIDVCESCVKECEKHAKKHIACKNCAVACKKFIEECKKIAA